MIEQIKQDLQKMTHGADWTNFDDREHSKVVYEYDRITESTCAIIAECQTVEMAQFIAEYPERLRYLIGEVERLKQGQIPLLKEEHEFHMKYRGQVSELRKALEQIYKMRPITCEWSQREYFNKFTEVEYIARQALERSNP
jgi:hypothetical protein